MSVVQSISIHVSNNSDH